MTRSMYETCILTLRLRISSFMKYLEITQAKINVLENRLLYYEMRLKGMKDESKASQFKKAIG